MNEFGGVGLYDHNADSYRKVREAFETSDVVGIVHATGTGKSYNALQLAYDNKDKKIVWLVPTNAIIEHIIKSINDNPNLDMDRDFPNLKFRTYQSFINMDTDEITELDIDLLILDEFHHIGAPVWGDRVNTIIETHPEMKIFGMTAYTVRDRGTAYERDMALDEGEELFSDNIVSEYDLCDAMIDGVLPKPIYRSSYIKLYDMASELEQRVQRLAASGRDCSEYIKILNDVKKKLHEAPSMGDVVKRNIKKNGKYIYFCPPFSEEGTNDIETIKKEAMSWFKELASEEDIVFYTSYSDMKDGGKSQREAFYDDLDLDGNTVDGKLRVMFAINQYNEGVHAPNIDGVIMGRGTCSDIVFFEQLGRALSVSSGVKKKIELYNTYSIERLRLMCSQNNISYNNDMSEEQLIEKLVAPVIIDLAGNIDFIRELEDNLKDRLKELKEKGDGTLIRGDLSDASFDLDMYEVDLFNILMDLKEKTEMTWDDWYKLAEAYSKKYGDLLVTVRFKTSDGITFDENGEPLGQWIYRQRRAYKNRSIPAEQRKNKIKPLTNEQVFMLESIGMVWYVLDSKWNKMYILAEKFYRKNGHLNVPKRFNTKDGITFDENGERLGQWVGRLRLAYKNRSIPAEQRKYANKPLTDEQVSMLESIGMVWDALDSQWNEMYTLAENFYKKNGHLNVPNKFCTKDGITFDENGENLYYWINTQRAAYKNRSIPAEQRKNKVKPLTDEQVSMLESIGMVWDLLDSYWNKMYTLAENFYKKNGHLNVSNKFCTKDGITFDENGENLYNWIHKQRVSYKNRSIPAEQRKNTNKPLTDEQVSMLESIGVVWDPLDSDWNKMYILAKEFYKENGHLRVTNDFYTKDGITFDENGEPLGQWIFRQRQAYKNRSIPAEQRKYAYKPLTDERVSMLESIGMIWDVRKNKSDIKDLCKDNNIDIKKNKYILNHISFTEFKVKLAYLKDSEMSIVDENGLLHEIFSMSSMNMKLKYGVSLEDLVNMYKEKNK